MTCLPDWLVEVGLEPMTQSHEADTMPLHYIDLRLFLQLRFRKATSNKLIKFLFSVIGLNFGIGILWNIIFVAILCSLVVLGDG